MAADSTKPSDAAARESASICAALSDEDMGAVVAAAIAHALIAATPLGREGKHVVVATAVQCVRDIRAGERAKLANQIKGEAIAKGMIS